MADGDCGECGGTGTVERDGKLHECVCEFLRRIASSMPPYIRSAKVMKQHAELPLLELLDRSLFVVSEWADMRAVLKAIWIKFSKLHVRITSDREIRDVYVGSTSRAAKGKDTDEPVMNNLQDLMESPDLVVVRLNELSYKNKAAPGALQEACSYRTDRDKPTWVVSDVSRPFTRGSHAWSEAVQDQFSATLRRFVVPPIAPKLVLEDILQADPVRTQQVGSRPAATGAPPVAPAKRRAKAAPKTGEAEETPPEPEETPPPRIIQSVPDDDGIPVGLRGAGGGLGRGSGKWKGR